MHVVPPLFGTQPHLAATPMNPLQGHGSESKVEPCCEEVSDECSLIVPPLGEAQRVKGDGND